MKINYYCFFLIFFTAFLTHSEAFAQTSQKFTIILDAGHGGKDPGNSYHGFTEKDIALKTTLKVGGFLNKIADMEVIYTRTTDVFVELVNRPKVANKVNANLFVSIHCNSVRSYQPYGTETFVMGLSRTDLNLEVAKKENSVILLEDNIKDNYQGFDPNKPESLIGLTIMQEENLNNSIILANEVQNNFTNNLQRNSRGIKQQPLWVLDAAYMPSVLIELGFLSNREEGEYLNSEEGQDQMAFQIASAIVQYKNKFYGTGGGVTGLESSAPKIVPKQIPVPAAVTSGTVYKVQLMASEKNIAMIPSNFKGLSGISNTYDSQLYRYMYGETNSEEEAQKLEREARNAGFPDAFVTTVN